MLGHAGRSHAEDLADTLNIKAWPFCLIHAEDLADTLNIKAFLPDLHEKALAHWAAGAGGGREDGRGVRAFVRSWTSRWVCRRRRDRRMRFTASLRKDETAKTVRPTGVPEKGPRRRSARPAALPRRLRMRRVLVGICPCRDVNGSLEGSRTSSTCHTALSLRREKPESWDLKPEIWDRMSGGSETEENENDY